MNAFDFCTRNDEPGGNSKPGNRLQNAPSRSLPHGTVWHHESLLARETGGSPDLRVSQERPGGLLHSHRSSVPAATCLNRNAPSQETHNRLQFQCPLFTTVVLWLKRTSQNGPCIIRTAAFFLFFSRVFMNFTNHWKWIVLFYRTALLSVLVCL